VRARATLAAAAAALAAAAGSCTLIDFDLPRIAETDDALCSDGRDNDFDGLADCQDWNCLGALPCCDIPEVLLLDDFDGGGLACDDAVCADAGCAALACGPDAELWHTWPCPYPRACDGALRIEKSVCFAAGVLSQNAVALAPGLRVTAVLEGRPERLGYLEVALTLQEPGDLPGALDPCGRQQRVVGFAAVRQIWHDDGYVLVAQFQEQDIATSPPVTTPDAPHTVSIGVDVDRRVSYALDGATFAVSDIALPQTEAAARVALTGITEAATFASVQVQAGLRCHDPTTWQLAGADLDASTLLRGSGVGNAFDGTEVYHPAVWESPAGLELYYTGCAWPPGVEDCDQLLIGIGHATASGAGEAARDADNPVLVQDDIPAAGLTSFRKDMAVDVLPGPTLRGYVAPTQGTAIWSLDAAMDPVANLLQTGSPGEWDGGEMCCATVVEHPDGTTYLWYAGRPTRESRLWQLGLATSTDGETFTRHPDNPILRPGPSAAFDSEAVLSPAIAYDAERALFRMWYEGRDFFGESAIGYAVSTDGAHWRRYDGNPVLTADDAGVASLGAPDVLLDPDGRLRMWVHAVAPGELERRIIQLANQGALLAP
jgi:hypothetical protein